MTTPPTITLADVQPGDAIWCAGSAERERLSQCVVHANCVVCPQGEQLEISEGRVLPIGEAAGFLTACGAQRLILTSGAEAPPKELALAGLSFATLQEACGADDFMAEEDTALVEQRLRELGYI